MHDEDKKNAECNEHFSDSFHAILEHQVNRRQVLKKAFTGAALASLPLSSLSVFANSHGKHHTEKINFKPIPVSNLLDQVIVPEGYSARVFYPWGMPIKSDGPSFKQDASNSSTEQQQQAGMHHDGMHYFPLEGEKDAGLLVMNHEYIDPTLLHTGGGYKDNPEAYTLEKTAKEIAAHGASVIKVKKINGAWQVVDSNYNRRITSDTPMQITGPAAGHRLLKTATDKEGTLVLGMNNNCASGQTPWGTYLSCEENFQNIFGGKSTTINNEQKVINKRYGVKGKSRFGWEINQDRFHVGKTPQEPNRFGWIVEFDPFNPNDVPKKRTAMGRFRHENVAILNNNNHLALYSGDDAHFEYIYKFVPNKPFDGNNKQANANLLDEGTLYVAVFNDDNTGSWKPLVHDTANLTKANGFNDQGDVLIKTRAAADLLGATAMDRPEWIAVDPETNKIYCCLTNNSKRKEKTNAANPRLKNYHGHIIVWQEKDNDPRATEFTWDVFMLGGGPSSDKENLRGNIQGDIFSSPDGLYIDQRGVMWLQTDVSGSKQNKGDFKNFGNNQMLAIDPQTKLAKRFLTGPVGCEVTGITMTPDMTAMWINIQHPGDVPGALKGKVKKTPQNPKAASSWPDGDKGGRPRSATVLITKDDGGVIGS